MRNPIDAPDIGNDAILLRRIYISMLDRANNTLQSWAWSDQNEEISVYVAAETTEERVLSHGMPEQMIIRISAGSVRKLGHIVVRDPETDEPAHCIIHPHPTKRIRKKFCERSTWD
jgi:hypothetical protein